ncbi:MAG: amidase [Armatimonadetes bacterium]|nr:amidase [Armatimonadota bacterium]
MGIDGSLTRKEFLGTVALLALTPRQAGAQTPSRGPDLNEADLAAAEKVAGITLDDAHRKLAVPGVKQSVANFPGIRALDMPNDVEPHTVFTPVGRQPKPGKKSSLKTAPVRVSSVPVGEDLAFLSVTEIGALLRSKRVTSTDLTELYLQRLQTYGPKLDCVVTLTAELARSQAKKADAELAAGKVRGPLHGVPYGIKDLFAVKGYRTTWGAEAFKDQVFDHDAAVVEKLTEAGAVCLAKLSCGALAYDDVWWGGQTKNPWNTKQGSSGSSAGSACATAAGLVGFSIGTETLGSIISPSNRCRVSGLRPTYGRVSRYGGMVLTYTMDKVGPICRTIEDCAVVLSCIHGADPRDLASVDRPFDYRFDTDVKKLKIGFLYGERERVDDPAPMDKAEFLKPLRDAGAVVRPVKFSDPPEGIWTLLTAEAAATFDRLTRSEDIERIGKLWPPEFLAARYLPAVEYINAHRARALMAKTFEEEFGDFDVVVTDKFWDSAFTVCNGTGHPQAIVPWGLNGSQPRSVSVIGRLYGEGVMAAVAHRIQSMGGYHRLRPDASKY